MQLIVKKKVVNCRLLYLNVGERESKNNMQKSCELHTFVFICERERE